MLPAAIPNLVVNGTTGIAVGMATNMAPHNLVEVVQALRHLIKPPRRPVIDDLMRFIPGPDLPTGGKIVGLDGIRDAYETGRGVVPDAGDRPGRVGDATPQGHRGHRAALQRRHREGHRADQDAGPGQEAPGHLRRQGPHRLRQRHCAWSSRSRTASTPRRCSSSSTSRRPLEDSFGINAVDAGRRPAAHARAQGAARGLPASTASTSYAAAPPSAAARPPTGCTWSRGCCSRSSTSTR